MNITTAATKVTLAVVLLTLFSCGPRNSSTPPALPVPREGTAPEIPTKQTWEKEWERTVSNARKEGKVIVLSGGTVTGARNMLIAAMKEKFGIDVEWISAPSSQAEVRILTEQRAGLYIADMYFSGNSGVIALGPPNAMEPVGPILVLPEVLEPKAWLGGDLPFFDPPKKDAFLMLGGVSTPIFVNTQIVRTDELKSYQDILNPKWKGKMIMQDPTQGGAGQEFAIIVAKLMGWDFLREFLKQEPVATSDRRLQTEWVARGKSLIGVGATWSIIDEFVAAGVPIKPVTMKEGSLLTSAAGIVVLLKRAPHPNATKVFINWILTREGQTLIQKGAFYSSRRIDITKEGLIPEKVPQPGVKLVDKDTAEFTPIYEEYKERAREIFLPYVTKSR